MAARTTETDLKIECRETPRATSSTRVVMFSAVKIGAHLHQADSCPTSFSSPSPASELIARPQDLGAGLITSSELASGQPKLPLSHDAARIKSFAPLTVVPESN